MRSLAEWLAYQQRIHARGIDLGLDRVQAVWERMGAAPLAPVVMTVGGTNGKGSTVAFLEAMLRAGGMRVGTYTSPHLLRYNERVRIAGAEVDDAALVDAFRRVEAARGATTLTYFEFGTLAAFDLFARAGLDVAVLEVGLGGRLDAVNAVDADCGVVVTVDLDHMDYLGADREAIGREQAGIFRCGRPAIVGEGNPPASLVAQARATGARLEVLGHDFGWSRGGSDRRWWHRGLQRSRFGLGDRGLAAGGMPGDGLVLEGDFQYRNAATAMAALHAMGDRVRWNPRVLEKPHLEAAGVPFLAGRLQHLDRRPDLVVDVGHNPQAARELALWLDGHPVQGTVRAVFSALADKDIEGLVVALGPRIDRWYLAGLLDESPRGETTACLAARVRAALPNARCVEFPDIAAAWLAARADAGADDRVLAFGSFHVVARVLRCHGRV